MRLEDHSFSDLCLGTKASLKMFLSHCSCKRRAQPCDEDVAQIGPKRIRYLGLVGKGKLLCHFPDPWEEEKVQLSCSVVGHPWQATLALIGGS